MHQRTIALASPDRKKPEEFKRLKTIVNHLTDTQQQSVNYEKLHLPLFRLVEISHESFGNDRRKNLHLGFVIAMVDKDDIANIFH